MIKSGKDLPDIKLASLLVVTFSVIPFSFGVYSMATAYLQENQTRANMVILGVCFWGVFTFGLNSLLYFNKPMWQRAKIRLTKSSSEDDASGA